MSFLRRTVSYGRYVAYFSTINPLSPPLNLSANLLKLNVESPQKSRRLYELSLDESSIEQEPTKDIIKENYSEPIKEESPKPKR